MKRYLFLCLFIGAISVGQSQIQFGLKGGLTFLADDGLTETINGLEDEFKGDGAAGYHAGIFARINLTGFYIQPELLYTSFSSDFENRNDHFETTYKRLDVPLNVGIKIIKIARIQAGPVFSYYFEDDINWDDVSNVEQDDVSLGMQVGAGLTLSNWNLDLRYEFPFGDKETDFIHDNSSFKTESNQKLLHLSIGYQF